MLLCWHVGRSINQSSALRSVSYKFVNLISKSEGFVKKKMSYDRNSCHLRLKCVIGSYIVCSSPRSQINEKNWQSL